jgi:hypothetical protein
MDYGRLNKLKDRMRREIESVKKIVEDIDTFFYPIEEM